jgi:hypothetical protein
LKPLTPVAQSRSRNSSSALEVIAPLFSSRSLSDFGCGVKVC